MAKAVDSEVACSAAVEENQHQVAAAAEGGREVAVMVVAVMVVAVTEVAVTVVAAKVVAATVVVMAVEDCTAQSRQQRAGCDPSAWRGCCSPKRWHRCTRPQDGRRSEPPCWLPRHSTWSGRSGCRQACLQLWR